jgi:hypothetical protein
MVKKEGGKSLSMNIFEADSTLSGSCRWLGLFGSRRQGHDFTRFAFGHHLERTATDLAIGRKPLAGDARVNRHRRRLAAERALDVRKFFHPANLVAPDENAMFPANLFSKISFPVCHSRKIQG